MAQAEIAQYVADIDRARARLKRLLRGQDAKLLNRRPADGSWAVVENVRHLLWAEQRHLGRFLSGKVEWNRTGLTAFRGREFADVGTKPTEDIAVVFAEWDAVHRGIIKAVKSAEGDVANALRGNHQHLAMHIAVIEKLLAGTERR